MLGGRVPSIRLQQQQRTSLPRRFRLLEDDLSTVLQDLLVHGVWQVLQIDLAHHLDTVGIQIEDLEVGVVVSVRDRWPVMIDGLPVSVSTAGGRLVGACLASPAVQVVEMMIRMMIQMMVMVMMVMMTRRTMTAMALALLTGLRQEILIDYYRTVPMAKLLLSLVKFGELPARAQRGAHLRRAVEQRVIHLVALPLLRVRDHRLEPVTPQDLLGQVARSRLSGLPGRLYRPLEDGHDLEPFRQHVLRGHVVERGLLVYPVNDRRRPYEEQVPVLPVRPHRQFLLILRQHLPLLRRPRPYQLSPDRGPDYVTLPHVAHPEHQAQFTVPLTDDRVPREQQRLSPLLRPAHLGEHYAHHERLDHHAHDALDAHDEDRLWALLGRATAPVTDRVLGLDAEQEAAREREYVVHARCPVVLDLVGRQVALLEVAVAERDQPPDHGEAQPREDEAQAEAEQHPSPLSVHQGREDVS